MTTYIKGNYRRSIYQNASGYNIGIFKVQDTNDEKLANYLDRTITFTGYFHELNDTDTYIFYGKLIKHEKYGEQFQVDSYERCKPEEKDSIIEFLTSGLFKGIGEKKAKKIVDVFAERVTEKDMISLFREDKYWNFYEWQPGLNGAKDMGGKETYEAPFHAFISDTFRCFAEICKLVKPDIVAPGTKIISCSNRVEKGRNQNYRNAYVEKSGTSMSAPIISGVLMGILLNYPNIGIKDIKTMLFKATTDIGYEKNMQGNGFINCKLLINMKFF